MADFLADANHVLDPNGIPRTHGARTALPGLYFCGFHVVSTASLLNQLCTEPIAMKDGLIPIPTGPGLGVEVDLDVLERYRV